MLLLPLFRHFDFPLLWLECKRLARSLEVLRCLWSIFHNLRFQCLSVGVVQLLICGCPWLEADFVVWQILLYLDLRSRLASCL